LFSFSWQWTDTFFSSIFLRDYQVLAKTLSNLTMYQKDYIDPVVRNAIVSSGIILCIAPLLMLYLLLQRFFIQGITRSGITG
jgi:multiple sugar transport system permease protein